jgi:antitoxin (DNA-binding transcriptional repressor) of toxin-antitoxin stability system
MSIDADIREVRGHVMGLIGSFNQFSGRVEERLEGIEITLTNHTRPCKDLIEVRGKVEKISETISRSPTEQNAAVKPDGGPEERSLLRLVLMKVVVPLVVALAGGFTAVVAYAFVRGG